MDFRGTNGFPMPPSGIRPVRRTGGGGGSSGGGKTRSIKRYKDQIDQLPDVRDEKVDDLRDAVEKGDYYVESEKIAKRVVDEALKEAVQRERSYPR